jgi:hypothetical protein
MKASKKKYLTFDDLKPYKPTPHPMQHRIDEFRSIPSLVTGRRDESVRRVS